MSLDLNITFKASTMEEYPMAVQRRGICEIMEIEMLLSNIDYKLDKNDKNDFLNGVNNYDYGEVCLPICILGNNYNKAYNILKDKLSNLPCKVVKDNNSYIVITMSDSIDLELPMSNKMDIHELLDSTPWGRVFISTDWHMYGDRYGKGKNMVNIRNIVKWCKNNIKPNDVFIHLGDLTHRFCNKTDQESAAKIYRSLPGIKVLILGNHDIPLGPDFYNNCGFDYIFKELTHKDMIFSHRPVKVELLPGININIHGHKHDITTYNITNGDNCVNCYPIFFNNKPVSLDYIIKHKDKLTKNNIHDYWTNYTESVESLIDNVEKNTKGNVDSCIIINNDGNIETRDITDIKFWYVSNDRFPEGLDKDNYSDYLIDAIDKFEDLLPDNQVYAFICNSGEDADEPICVGIISIDENKQIKWEIQYPINYNGGKYSTILKAKEWSMASMNPVVGIKQPYILKVRHDRESMDQYVFSSNLISDKYFIIDENAKLKMVSYEDIKDYYVISEYKYIGDIRNIDKIYEAYDNNKIVDNTFFYTALTNKPLLTEDQFLYDESFKCSNNLIGNTIINNSIMENNNFIHVSNTKNNNKIKYSINGYYVESNNSKSKPFKSYNEALICDDIISNMEG